jgi:hypothetical protein
MKSVESNQSLQSQPVTKQPRGSDCFFFGDQAHYGLKTCQRNFK